MKVIEFVMMAIILNILLAGVAILGLNIPDQTMSISGTSYRDLGGSLSDERVVLSGSSAGSLDCSGQTTMACNIQSRSDNLILAQSGVDSQKSFLDNVKMLIDGIVFFARTIGEGVLAPGGVYKRLFSSFTYGNFAAESTEQMNFVAGLINLIMYLMYGIAAVQLMTGRDLKNTQ